MTIHLPGQRSLPTTGAAFPGLVTVYQHLAEQLTRLPVTISVLEATAPAPLLTNCFVWAFPNPVHFIHSEHISSHLPVLWTHMTILKIVFPGEPAHICCLCFWPGAGWVVTNRNMWKPQQVKLPELPLESVNTSVESDDLFCWHLGHYVLDGNEKRHSDKIKTTLALKSGLNLFFESKRIWIISSFFCCWCWKRKHRKKSKNLFFPNSQLSSFKLRRLVYFTNQWCG